MSPCNHGNFPGALWRTDNRVREEFLFSSSPLPPSLLPSFSLVLTSTPLSGSLLDPRILQDFPWLGWPVFAFYVRSEVWIPAQRKLLRTTVAIIARCYLSESLLWTLGTIQGLYFCASRRLFCVGTGRNVLQRHCLSPWFLCLHFRGCAVKPWCSPRDQSPWEYAMLNSKYDLFFLSVCDYVKFNQAYILGSFCSMFGCMSTWAIEILWKFNGVCVGINVYQCYCSTWWRFFPL